MAVAGAEALALGTRPLEAARAARISSRRMAAESAREAPGFSYGNCESAVQTEGGPRFKAQNAAPSASALVDHVSSLLQR